MGKKRGYMGKKFNFKYAEIWEKIIFDRGDMGKYAKNHKRGDMGKYRGDMKFPLDDKFDPKV
jgi:hypothetical protein